MQHHDDELREDAERLRKSFNEPEHDEDNLLKTQGANGWLLSASKKPVPKMLFDAFWFEGELCILFADTNLGKSILAVQIADSISKGIQVPYFRLEAVAQTVLYCDFELSEKQFETRYSIDSTAHYQFSPTLFRAEIDPDVLLPDPNVSFEDYLNVSLERRIIETGATVLIIDNITYLRMETERAKDALPLMKHLKALKSKYRLSILALAHTPKRDLSKPITRNDLQGSKMLINFCDSAFAIGESHSDKSVRYLKQIKQRNTEPIYNAGNVCVCQVEKPGNFLQFSFLRYGDEREHLREKSEDDKTKLVQEVLRLHAEGRTQREIAKELGISLGSVNKFLKM